LPKAVVCHVGSRDRYEVAAALAGAGLLEKVVTDLYLAPERIPFLSAFGRRFPKILARSNRLIPADRVVAPLRLSAASLLMRIGLRSRDRQIRLDLSIGRRARYDALKSKSALFSYSYYAAGAFAEGANRPAMRFLFQLHPHPAVVRKIFQREMIEAPRFARSLRWEYELGAPEAHFASLCQESSLANGWVTASSYTASTLAQNGVPRQQIHVVPYGVDFEEYACRDRSPSARAPFRVVWVGNMTQRKGLSYFLEAVGAIPQENLEVLVCGNYAIERQVIQEYGIRSIRILRGLATGALTDQMRGCDLFVLPSLAEGFGHAILEAMALGLPVLTTANTCAPDVLVDGEHGFVVPVRDNAALAKAITWGRSHRAQLYRMGLAGAARARQFTWERFRKGIVAAYCAMVEHQLAARGGAPL
jgi:glycosyltransferase involved in cell wall biosynthesis